jgi:hypothetical protein
MSKNHLKKYSAQFEDIPNEVITEIFKWLDLKAILKCTRVSKRIRSISQNEVLWQKVNLHKHQDLSCEFVKMVIENGCRYLNLSIENIHDNLSLEKPTKLKYLHIMGVPCQNNSVLDRALDKKEPVDRLERVLERGRLRRSNQQRIFKYVDVLLQVFIFALPKKKFSSSVLIILMERSYYM